MESDGSDSQTLSLGRQRRGMVSGCSVSHADGRKRATATAFAARAFQRSALRAALRHRPARHAHRPAALVGRVSAIAALAGWRAGVFEELAQDLRALLRVASGRAEEPTAAIIDSRTLRSTPESGPRAGYDGAKRKRGSKPHMAVDTLGRLLALHVTPANVDDRAEVGKLAAAVRDATGESVELIYVDQGYTGEKAAEAAKAQGVELCVVKLSEAKKGFVLLPKRWVVERSFAWATRCRRLVKDYERYAETLAGLHVVAFACLMLKQAAEFMIQSA